MSFIFARLLEIMFFKYTLVRRENGCFNYKSFKLKTYFFNLSGQCNLSVKKNAKLVSFCQGCKIVNFIDFMELN